jgi:oxygen-independent coproporphyrinogen-3 oxidase
VGDSYSQNPRDLAAWQTVVDQGRLPVWRGIELDGDDVLRADAIQELMCRGEIDIGAFEYRHQIEFPAYFASTLERLQPLVEDGLVRIDPNVIAATSRGRLLLRIIAMCFDHYLTSSQTDSRSRFSRVI